MSQQLLIFLHTCHIRFISSFPHPELLNIPGPIYLNFFTTCFRVSSFCRIHILFTASIYSEFSLKLFALQQHYIMFFITNNIICSHLNGLCSPESIMTTFSENSRQTQHVLAHAQLLLLVHTSTVFGREQSITQLW